MANTPEENLREAMKTRLESLEFFSSNAVPVYSLANGDLVSLIQEALSTMGVAVLVRTPRPAKAHTRGSQVIYWAWECQVLTVESPVLNQDKPGAFEVARAVEAGLQLWDPGLAEFASQQPKKFLMRVDPSTPREDVSPDEVTIQLLSKFNFSQKEINE